ncbi:Uncharacterised protein [uncultured archaeon]|nr:Uncharacterised protein [uncultured archaeon]
METQTTEQKPTLGISVESMKRIEDQAGQWMILEEHYTQYGLDRRQQLDYARQLYKSILAEIRQVQRESPLCSDLVSA